jgi:hypothetical protein
MGCCDILKELDWKLRDAIDGLVKRAATGTIVREARRVESATRGNEAMFETMYDDYIVVAVQTQW